jgi:hypothetical protein
VSSAVLAIEEPAGAGTLADGEGQVLTRRQPLALNVLAVAEDERGLGRGFVADDLHSRV